MDANTKAIEECKVTWREEARARALDDLKAEKLEGKDAEEFCKERSAKYYAELEKIGLEGIE